MSVALYNITPSASVSQARILSHEEEAEEEAERDVTRGMGRGARWCNTTEGNVWNLSEHNLVPRYYGKLIYTALCYKHPPAAST